MATFKIFACIFFGGIWAINNVPDGSATHHLLDDVDPIVINATFGTQCQEHHECDTDRNQYCDIIERMCQCIPYSAYDQVAGECRWVTWDLAWNHGMYKYMDMQCPVGSVCFNSQTYTRFCQNDDNFCNIKTDVHHCEDMTYAFYHELVFVVTICDVNYSSSH